MLCEYSRADAVSLRGFHARRVLRILPAYVAFLMFVAALAAAGLTRIGVTQWLECLTYTVNFLRAAWMPLVIGHIWILSVEEHFYLIWPATDWFIERPFLKIKWRLSARTAGPASDDRQAPFPTVRLDVPVS